MKDTSPHKNQSTQPIIPQKGKNKGSSESHLIDENETNYPDIFQKYYPRKYAGVGGWTSPKVPATVFTISERMPLTDSVPNQMDSYNIAQIRNMLSAMCMPTYWVGAELVQAVAQTVPPDDMVSRDLLMPLQAMVFILPERTLLLPDGKDSSWLAVMKGGCLEEGDSGSPSGDCLVVCTGAPGSTRWVSILPPETPLSYFEDESICVTHSDEGEIDDEGKAFAIRVFRMAISLVMLTSAHAELVDTQTPSGSPKLQTGKAARRPCSPNWIGRNYRVSRSPLGGHHAPPRMHWRRGHWREQAHGQKYMLKKYIWVAPQVIGG